MDERNDILDFQKIKTFWSMKENVTRVRRQATEWKKKKKLQKTLIKKIAEALIKGYYPKHTENA